MGFLEWWGESYNPGGVGGFEQPTHKPIHKRWAVLTRFAVSAAAIGAGLYFLFAYGVEPTHKTVALTMGATFVYLFLSFVIRPAPDMNNIGWLGGLMDHPFRYSDDINRVLLWLKLLLLPGRLIAESFVDMAILVFNARKSG